MTDDYTAPGVPKKVAAVLNSLEPGDRFRISLAAGRWADARVDNYVGTYLGRVASGNGNVSTATLAMTGTRGPDRVPVVFVAPAYLVKDAEVLETRGRLAAEYLALTPAGARMAVHEDAKRALRRRVETESTGTGALEAAR